MIVPDKHRLLKRICEMDNKKFLRAIKGQRTNFAQIKERGTRAAETYMCRKRARGAACLPRGQSESDAARGKTPPGRMRLAQGGIATKPSAP